MGQVEAPLLVRPYLSKMTSKELLILMTAEHDLIDPESIMIALVTMLQIQFGDINLIQHLITASVLSIPAAIMYANIMIPSNEITDFSEGEVPRIYESSMDAITRGTRDGVDIAVNVGAILVVFIALVYLVDSVLGLLPPVAGREVSLQMILGFIFYPIVWLMGVPLDEVMISAELLGVKTALNEFVAYAQLSGYKSFSSSRAFMIK